MKMEPECFVLEHRDVVSLPVERKLFRVQSEQDLR